MSRENAESLMRAFEAAQRDPDAEGFYAILDPDVEWDVAATFPDATTYRGHEGVREFFRRWIGTFDSFGFETEKVIDAGDSVVVGLRQGGQAKGSGVKLDTRFWQVWTFPCGKVIRYHHSFQKPEALEAVGLRE